MVTGIEDRIRAALETAPELEHGRLAFPEENVSTVRDLVDGPGVMYIDTAEELRLLLRQTYAILGTRDDQLADATARHEDEHAEAGRILGSGCVRFRVLFNELLHPLTGERLQVHTKVTCGIDNFDTTPHELAVASIWAYPSEPSGADLAHLASSGYSVERVAVEALRENREHGGYKIPVPLSYRPTGQALAS